MKTNRNKDLSPLEKIINLGTGHKSVAGDGGVFMSPSSFFKKQTSLTGLALIELLVVIVIIAFSLSLCAALGPSMDRARESANRALCAERLRQIGLATAMYSDSYGGFLPWYGGKDPDFKSPFNCTPGSSGCPEDDEIHPYVAYRNSPDHFLMPDGSLRPLRLACLYESGFINDPRIFYCPSETEIQYQYDSYTHPYPPNTSTEWGTLPQVVNTLPGMSPNQYVRTGYTYYPTSPDTPTFNTLGFSVPSYTVRRFGQMDTEIPYLTDRIWKRTGSDLTENRPKPVAHRLGGVYSANALFKDGHVFYCKNQNVFNSEIWDMFEQGLIDYRAFYYKTFEAIGNCSRGEEPWPE